jgi:hypothetical protein
MATMTMPHTSADLRARLFRRPRNAIIAAARTRRDGAGPKRERNVAMKGWLFGGIVAVVLSGAALAGPVVVFEEKGFPVADSAPVPAALLHRVFQGADFTGADRLARTLQNPSAKLLVLPYGSAFPEAQWPAIHAFLVRGGNLLTLGGRPFTRPVLREGRRWTSLPETYAFARRLLISDYQTTPGAAGLTRVAARPELGSLVWNEAYSAVIRLSQQETAKRAGGSGTFDATERALVWGDKDGRHLSAPVIAVDHLENDFAGGRWVMLNADLAAASWQGKPAEKLLYALADEAKAGAKLFRVTPSYPLYLTSEAWRFEVNWSVFENPPAGATLDIVVRHDGRQEASNTFAVKPGKPSVAAIVTVPTTGTPGFHTVEAVLHCGAAICGQTRTAFWVRDRPYLTSGPKLTADANFFRLDGKPLMVVGTTYMDSIAQRLMFRFADPAAWDDDMGQIADGGLNMLRTGIWTDWDKVADADGTVKERTLRTLEAYLMTARRHGLPVQFTLFAFMPDVFGGANPYLDPEGLARQHQFAASLARSFADVPFLSWDLINEPSFDNPDHFFTTRANGDAHETKAWNAWLLHRYGSRDAVARAWRTVLPDGPIPVPGDGDSSAQSANDGGRPLATTDFVQFAQESFADWTAGMRSAIRAAGSAQMITVGQDEGGALISPSPNFFKDAVDFTTVHSWWFNDDILWDSLSARQKGLPMLVQETGIMTEVNADGRPRRTPQQDAALLERKLGVALATGTGAIQWLWDVNAIMRSQQEVTIGAIRPDGTEKPDTTVLRRYAAFAKTLSNHLSAPAPEQVAILTSQATQFSVLQGVASDAQHRAVRVMNFQCRTPARLIGENNVAEIAGTKLVVLPSALMLRQTTWLALLDYVRGGGTLLITGSAERDENWQPRDRLKALGLDAEAATLSYRSLDIDVAGQKVPATFSNASQRSLEALRLPQGRSFAELSYGKGRILIVTAPIELAESPDVTTAVYRYALAKAGVTTIAGDVPQSVLVRPVTFADSTLYLFVSEDAADRDVTVRDAASGVMLRLTLPAERTKLLLVDNKTGAILASYDAPNLAPEK